MAFVGFLTLGVFVGCVAVLGFKQAENDFVKVGAAIFAAALGGTPIAFANKIYALTKAPDSIFMYPVGLLVAVPWFYMPNIISLGTNHPRLRNWAIAGTVLITGLAVALAFIPAFRAWVQ